MSYKLFDSNGNEVTHQNLQNKGTWCRKGASKEEVFVSLYGIRLNVVINPEKIGNPYAPDLSYRDLSNCCDLKTQNTPFFQSRSRYQIDPQWAVVFNLKDAERYAELYPGIDLLFWVDWQVVRFEAGDEVITVAPCTGVWKIGFPRLREMVQSAPIHSYQQRINDVRGNAKRSYVIDISSKDFERVI